MKSLRVFAGIKNFFVDDAVHARSRRVPGGGTFLYNRGGGRLATTVNGPRAEGLAVNGVTIVSEVGFHRFHGLYGLHSSLSLLLILFFASHHLIF